MRLEFTSQFKKTFKKLPKIRQERAQKALERFLVNPNHPSLRLHKLENIGAWSISAKKDRIILDRHEDDEEQKWIVLDMGSHDKIYRKMNRKLK